MGSKGDGIDKKQPCEYRHENCLFVNEFCETEQCGFYFRINGKFSIDETIEELRLCGVDAEKIKSLNDILDPLEFRKQALFRFYRPCDNQ